MSKFRLVFRGSAEAVMLLLLLVLASSVYADTAQQALEHESIVVLDVENMT